MSGIWHSISRNISKRLQLWRSVEPRLNPMTFPTTRGCLFVSLILKEMPVCVFVCLLVVLKGRDKVIKDALIALLESSWGKMTKKQIFYSVHFYMRSISISISNPNRLTDSFWFLSPSKISFKDGDKNKIK